MTVVEAVWHPARGRPPASDVERASREHGRDHNGFEVPGQKPDLGARTGDRSGRVAHKATVRRPSPELRGTIVRGSGVGPAPRPANASRQAWSASVTTRPRRSALTTR